VVHTLVFRFLLLGLSVAVGLPGLAPDARAHPAVDSSRVVAGILFRLLDRDPAFHAADDIRLYLRGVSLRKADEDLVG
jgi:hypothetical protein